jgi:Skp family chaperone for outer membrane proteins
MNCFTKNNIITLTLVTIIIALVGLQTFANRPAAVVPGGPVATFDLERTFNAIFERQAAFDELPKIARELEARGEEQRRALEQMRADLDIHVPGSAKRRELEDKLEQAAGNYRAFVEFSRLKLEAERGKALKKVYLSIRKAVGEFAQSHGYSLVLVDDSAADIPPGTLEELNRQISARRVAYTGVDITDQLIEHINDAFIAAGGVVPRANAQPNGNAP